LCWLAGHHQVPRFFTLAAAAAWLFQIFRREGVHLPCLRLAMLSAVLCFDERAAALPAYEYGKLSRRFISGDQQLRWNQAVPYAVHSDLATRPRR
jgi:hypothetical protein